MGEINNKNKINKTLRIIIIIIILRKRLMETQVLKSLSFIVWDYFFFTESLRWSHDILPDIPGTCTENQPCPRMIVGYILPLLLRSAVFFLGGGGVDIHSSSILQSSCPKLVILEILRKETLCSGKRWETWNIHLYISYRSKQQNSTRAAKETFLSL